MNEARFGAKINESFRDPIGKPRPNPTHIGRENETVTALPLIRQITKEPSKEIGSPVIKEGAVTAMILRPRQHRTIDTIDERPLEQQRT